MQLHGGISMTEEHLVGHYFRRLMMFEPSFGDTAYYLNRLAVQVARRSAGGDQGGMG